MDLDFSKNYFELFGLPVGFELDEQLLAERFRHLQSELHPDRYANASDQERRLSVQGASLINQAYQTLRIPLERAKYLLQLKGIDTDSGQDMSSDPMFLMQQIELREEMEAIEGQADPFAALDKMDARIRSWNRELQQEFAEAYAEDELEQAGKATQKLQFFNRLFDEIKRLEEKLEHELI
jgi:molecular chaperone HscB